ncbi:YpiB family protein [Atopobacter phocae]|uniref:YpiB family protein n=1 Tax=Atopobacter phocae TaxID=136492 RepID=UPI000471FF86|nr:YpiB family protein [Atopobacter phocae]
MTHSSNDKKRFLKWFIENYELSRRESLWILNYLLNHDFILPRIHFSDDVHLTDNGLVMSIKDAPERSFEYYQNGRLIQDPEIAFHELRTNWRKDFYVELLFDHSYETLLSFNIYEAHQEQDQEELEKKSEATDSALRSINRMLKENQLKQAIDRALDDNDFETVKKLSDELITLKED